MSDHDRSPYTPPSDRLAFDPRQPVRSGPAPVTLIASALILIGLVGGVAYVYRHGARHPGAAPAEVGTPVADMKSPAPPDANAAASSLSIDKTESANAAPVFAPPPEAPQLRPALPASAPAGAAPQAIAASAPPPAPPAPAARPITIASLADAAVAPAAKPKPKAAIALAPALSTAPLAAGWVQIGAFSSPALADKGWSDIARLEPAAMAGKGRKVEATSVNGKSFYRAYVTGFASRTAAEGFCDKLKAAAKPCLVK